MEKIEVKVSWCSGNYSASLGENVPGAVVFTASSFSELQKEAENTLIFHMEGMAEDGETIPQWFTDNDYEFSFNCIDTSTVLHICIEYASLAAVSRVTGINRYQLSHYATGLKKPRSDQQKRILEGVHRIGKALVAVV